jgi:beta-xylosidase
MSTGMPVPSVLRRIGSSLGLAIVATTMTSCWLLNAPSHMTPVSTPSADPSLLFDANTFYRYTTQNAHGRVPVAKSGSLSSGWGTPKEALRTPAWWAVGNFWAPTAVKVGSTFYLYYAASLTSASPVNADNFEHAIGVACGTHADGPFDDCDLAPFGLPAWVVRDDAHHYGAIDPYVLYGGGGRYYLLWSIDWGPAGRRSPSPRKIRGCRLATNMKQCDTTPVDLLVANGGPAWEHGTVESPAMALGQDGHYYLFYSGGNFENAYATHEATCGTTPLSACTRIGDGPLYGDGWNGLTNIGGMDLALIPLAQYNAVWVATFHASGDFNPANGDPRTAYASTVYWYQN